MSVSLSRRVALLLLAATLGFVTLAEGAEPARPAVPARVQFNRDIRPILSETCFHCHGPDASHREGELRLDRAEDALRLHDGHAAVVPGKPEASELYRRITSTDPDERMPPKSSTRQLSPQQIETLRQWIVQGAEYQPHWSLAPVKRPELPRVQNGRWSQRPLDAFVLERLEREGLTPAPVADPATLYRRLSLDLTGLPPSPEEVARFLQQSAASPLAAEMAYGQLVDRLLASPRFGERMAVPWLDAARYADTNGYQSDGPRQMWRWRDQLIDALNANQPFDQFTIEQLAGDLLPNATLEQRIASGFHRNHRGNAEGGIIPEEFRIEYVVDRVETTATVWMGLTLGCSRCHDHKYDPFTQREFYQLFAFFNNVPELGKVLRDSNSPPVVLAPNAEMRHEMTTLAEKLSRVEQQIAAKQTTWDQQQTAWETEQRKASQPLPWAWTRGEVDHFPLDSGKSTPERPFQFVDGQERFAPGLFDKAVELDGKTIVELGNHGKLSETERASVGVWIWPTNVSGGTIISRMESDFNHRGWALSLDEGKLQFHLSNRYLDDAMRLETVQPLVVQKWQHVCVTFDGAPLARGVRLYVDGVQQETRILLDLLSNAIKNDEPLRLGSGVDETRFAGRIDDVRFFNRELTADQVALVACADSIDQIIALEPKTRTSAQRAKLRAYFLTKIVDAADQTLPLELERLQEEKWVLEHGIPTVMVMQELPEPRPSYLLVRGEYDKPGDRVYSSVPAVLPALPQGAKPDRLALARWLVDPQHPLTSRVAVNRFWQLFFGLGLVKTSEDFGSQGEPPSHPELLDYLASEWMAHDWDMKWLVREIVMSATYRQSSHVDPKLVARDPENRLLGRGARFRLSADVVRDQALAAAALLVERVGGPSVKPYQPAGLWEEVASSGSAYVQDHGADLHRRSLYTFWKRTVPPPGMMTFDAAGREACVVRTARTNTPLQALALLNDVTYVEAARGIAQRVLLDVPGPPREQIQVAFQRLLVRAPTAAELDILTRNYERALSHYQRDSTAAKKLLAFGESSRDERVDWANQAALATVCGVILNLDEVVTRE